MFNCQLYRTTPKLSGNLKLDLVTYAEQNELKVKDFHLRPISNIIPFNSIDEDILIRPHQMNIVRFYQATKGSFYQAVADPDLVSDWYMNDEDDQQWDDTYWAGAHRMSYKLYNTTHEVLIPVWLESCTKQIDIKVKMIMEQSGLDVITKTLTIKRPDENSNTYNNRFGNYFFDYLEHVKITEGNDNCININLTDNISYIAGLNVQSGNYQTKTDFNIARNLLFRERPLLEANSLITNTFADMSLILPQLINFNICFNPIDWVTGRLEEVFGKSFAIETEVLVDGKSLPKYDIYTNHHFIPRPKNQEIFQESTWTDVDEFNALDYKHDYKCLDLIHKNKIVQPICHWALTSAPDVLFNLYDGFGASYDGQSIAHFFGSVNDPGSTVTDHIIPNTNPFGPKMLGDGDEVEYVLNHAIEYYERGFLKSLASGWYNNFSVKYEPQNGISDIWIAGMTTPMPHERYYYKTTETQHVTNMNHIAMWTNKFDANGVDQVGNKLYTPMAAADRIKLNCYGLYFCTKMIEYNGQSVFVVLIWDQQVKRGQTSEGLIFQDKYSNQNIGFIVEALRKYLDAWNADSDKFKYGPTGVLNNLNLLNSTFKASKLPGVWYFNNTIHERQDKSLSDKAEEITYVKAQAADAYVYRFDGNLKPAMYPQRTKYEDGKVLHCEGFGRNFFWMKLPFDKDKKAYKQIAPRYTSVNYDSMILNDKYGKDLCYDRTYYDSFDSEHKSEIPSEYKWFDKSHIVQYPVLMTDKQNYFHELTDADIEGVFRNELAIAGLVVSNDEWEKDKDYIMGLYDIKYRLLKWAYRADKTVLYTYKIIISLK